jgi:hypothetical protein
MAVDCNKYPYRYARSSRYRFGEPMNCENQYTACGFSMAFTSVLLFPVACEFHTKYGWAKCSTHGGWKKFRPAILPYDEVELIDTNWCGLNPNTDYDITISVPSTLTKKEKKVSHRRYFMIWSPEGVKPPKQRFSKEWQAEGIALKLALQFPNQKFYVLQSKSRFITLETEVTRQQW